MKLFLSYHQSEGLTADDEKIFSLVVAGAVFDELSSPSATSSPVTATLWLIVPRSEARIEKHENTLDKRMVRLSRLSETLMYAKDMAS